MRKRWVYIDGQAIEVGADYRQEPEKAEFLVLNDRHYDGLQATDGTDISTRAKHRRYMRDNNLTTMDDYTETWKRDAKEREDRMAGVDKNRKRDVIEAYQKVRAGYRPKIDTYTE